MFSFSAHPLVKLETF